MALVRETQRISLRAYLRSLLQSPQIAQTNAIQDFFTKMPIQLTDEDVEDIARRKAIDRGRVEEQKQFYEIARKRAAALDAYMEQYVTVPTPILGRGVTLSPMFQGGLLTLFRL